MNIDQLKAKHADPETLEELERLQAELAQVKKERDQNDINYGLEKADHERTKEELAALRKKIEEAEPTAWCDVNEISFVSDDFRQNAHSSMAAYHHIPLYTLEGIKE